jgi:sn-glycerol 3-phosphate transport system substrate-binding protein
MARQGEPFANHDNGRRGRATEINLTSPQALAFVRLWAQMVKDGTFANVGRGWDPAEQNFLAGRSAMLITSTSDVFEVIRKAPFPVATAALPTPDPKVKGGTIVGGNALWILKRKDSAEQEASYRFVRYMASAPVQRNWHTHTGYFPIREDVIDALTREGFYKQYPAAKTAIDQLRASPDLPATRGALLGVFPEARENVDSAVERILTGGADPVSALGQAKAQSEAAISRYNRGRSGS